MNLQTPYYLFMTDVKNSTRLAEPERTNALEKLDNKLADLSKRFRPELGLTRSYGDEVAGLFNEPTHLFEIASEIREALYPETTMRFVVCRGLIGFVAQDITLVGGPIFKKANQLIERAKKERRFSRWATGEEKTDNSLSALTEISNLLLVSMTSLQRQVYTLVKQGLNHTEIAGRLNKQRQQITEAVKRSGTGQILEAESAIQESLDSLRNS